MSTINLIFDANAQAAPQSFRDAVKAGAAILDAAITDPIAVNIAVGYGEISGPNAMQLTDSESFGGPASGVPVSYSALRTALLSNTTSVAETSAISALPNTASLDGQSIFYVASAQAKALGAIAPTNQAIDGYIGFPASFSADQLVTASIIEIAHAMGLQIGSEAAGLFVQSLVSYSGAGQLSFTQPSGTPAYFSTDGGTSHQADYDVSSAFGSDPTLFENKSADPLNDPDTGATILTPLDLTELSAIGFDSTSIPVLPLPSITPVSGGTNAVITTQDFSVVENSAVSVVSAVKSVSAPNGDGIEAYAVEDEGGDGGYLDFNGVAEPDGQFFSVLSSQLGQVDYAAGSAPGSETLVIYPYDYDTGEYGQWGASIATTCAACYARGTLIGATNGEVPVEALAIGNMVVTASGQPRPVTWIGRRSYAGRFLAANPGVQPIRFHASSLGNGLPRRDLLVSPEHAMFLDGLLIPARCLANGISIVQERGLKRVDYYHVELDSHDVIVAEGAPSETFLDDAGRSMFHNASEFAALYRSRAVPGRFCAPKVDEGYQLEAIRHRLAVVAGEITAAA